MYLLQYFLNRINTAINFLLAVLFGLLSTIVNAEQLSGQFNLTVNLQSSDAGSQIVPNSAFCRSTNAPGSFGATFTVVCATGALVDISPIRTRIIWSPDNGNTYRYIFQASRDGNILGTVDSYVEVGNETSWSVIDLVDRVYLEMLVDW